MKITESQMRRIVRGIISEALAPTLGFQKNGVYVTPSNDGGYAYIDVSSINPRLFLYIQRALDKLGKMTLTSASAANVGTYGLSMRGRRMPPEPPGYHWTISSVKMSKNDVDQVRSIVDSLRISENSPEAMEIYDKFFKNTMLEIEAEPVRQPGGSLVWDATNDSWMS